MDQALVTLNAAEIARRARERENKVFGALVAFGADAALLWLAKPGMSIPRLIALLGVTSLGFFFLGRIVERWFYRFHTIPIEMLTELALRAQGERDEALAQQRIAWLAEREKFHREELAFRHRLDRFLPAITRAVARAWDRASEMTSWHDLLEATDSQVFLFSTRLFTQPYRLGAGEELATLKEDLREIRGFFNRCQRLLEDFPDEAPDYLSREVKRQQKDVLHLVVRLAEGQGFSTYGDEAISMPREAYFALWESWKN